MKILILNGNPDTQNSVFENYIVKLTRALEEIQHTVTVLTLRDMDIKHCTGCWSCWIATPGQCHLKDDSRHVARSYINSECVIFASPVIMGFTSALLKKSNDKLLPLLHPYIELVNGEQHHQRRYKNYPRTALLLEKTPETDEEDIQIITDIYARNALNLKTELLFVKLTSNPVNEIVDEINRI